MPSPPIPTSPRSLWLDRTDAAPLRPSFDDTAAHGQLDVAVVGGGITGLITALLCARRGARVGVFEAGRLGQGATGNTSAKLTVLHELIFDPIRRRHGVEAARAYAEANETGLRWIVDYCDGLTAAAVERQSAFTYATSRDDVSTLEDEVDAARAAGVSAELVDGLDNAFGAVAAVRVEDQAQFDPVPFLYRLAEDIEAEGGTIWEGTRVLGVSDGSRAATVHTSGGDVAAPWVVAATGLPFVDRSLFFARCEPKGSYVVAGPVDEPVEGMWISTSSPTRSVRGAPGPDGGHLVLVGGESHKTGQDIRSLERYGALAADAAGWFGVTSITHRWFTEDFMSSDKLPFVGPMWPLPTRVLVATGYSKWGLTNAAAASMTLAALVTGQDAPPWAATFDSNRLRLSSVPELAKANLDVAASMAKGWTKALTTRQTQPPEGRGVVVRRGRRADAVSNVDGDVGAVSAVCTHLGGIVAWNEAEASWDCPLHGSRFCRDGTLLHGPAVNDLAPRRSGWPSG